MRELIIKILREQTEDKTVNDNPLSRKEITLFKYLNKNKDNLKTKKELISVLRSMMPMIGRPESEANFYYEVYTANYRENGDYENITKETFKDFKGFQQRKTTNNNAYEYTSSTIPFKGSNLEGKWGVTPNNKNYYVVLSYEWYPIYLYIDNSWYRVSRDYSRSTQKQIARSNPIRYDNGINSEVTIVTPDEMRKLMFGHDIENIKQIRVPSFIKDMKDKVVGAKKMFKSGWGASSFKVGYLIEDIIEENSKVKITIKILKAGDSPEGKLINNPDYLQDPNNLEKVQKVIMDDIIQTHREYLTSNNTEFNFIY